ncbi:MBL fold metallo-hydrolase [Psychrosphaera aquimarina]|uniref:MBL fold metallo-hydrolase n=1 Tax=Psychrosphaera aquimarina TaxID=2044854 RepID=A0ABU3QWS7_9GAMM|nr:rhodanese-like domain-containing protein [Psychrosphaera aquimarina]MDU0111886.1 MBL fold metallo-hydrolase [Psychrosphaera aquimarina]
MIFRQLFDAKSSTFTYILADEKSKVSVIIDPVFEQVNRDLALINELGLKLAYVFDTHCHADHVTGSWLLKHKTNSLIASAKAIGAENVDVQLKDNDKISFGQYEIEVRATPGHTDGCLTYVLHSQKMAFTGDALLIRGCGRCDFQQGSASQLFDSILQQIFSLPDDFSLYPGHDYSGRCSTSVAEEKQFNARLGGNASKQDFIGYMDNMKLPHPKYIDIALPGNLVSGKPEEIPQEPTWAPVELSYGGIYQVSPYWVATHLDKVTILDVRENEEVQQSKIKGAVTIPLGEVSAKLSTIPTDKPIVTFCRSGRRSALAVDILKKSGLTDVANIKGGMLAWQDQSLPYSF